MLNANLARIINSDEVRCVVRPIKKEVKRTPMKKNPLKNLNAMLKLNLYAKIARRMTLLAEAQWVKAKKERLDKRKAHLVASMLSNCQASHFRNLFIYLSIFIFHFILFYLILLSHIFNST
ncbi:hypothetical protein AAG906_016385 [Vitis piasezkii]